MRIFLGVKSNFCSGDVSENEWLVQHRDAMITRDTRGHFLFNIFIIIIIIMIIDLLLPRKTQMGIFDIEIPTMLISAPITIL